MMKGAPLKVLFLSSDTGGGHRASAEALAKQFLIYFPGSTYDLLDIWEDSGLWPYRNLAEKYKHLSSHPNQWRVLYHLTNTQSLESLAEWYSTTMCEEKIRQRIESYDPDLVVSVHPAMQHAPLIATQKISQKKGKHLPFFTVVTDLGSAHSMWFQKDVEKIYLASDQLYRLARSRGQTPAERICMSGLPIRHDFAEQAQKLGDRTSPAGKGYQKAIRRKLGIETDDSVVLLMGGGEGVGSLSTITENLYKVLSREGPDTTICVVCGRNEELKENLSKRDWKATLKNVTTTKNRSPFRGFGKKTKVAAESVFLERKSGTVKVVALGFVHRIAEYMVAADVLLSKAGPGTISEAAALGLPVLLTSFLPGQEAGNVDFVLQHEFGDFVQDPIIIAQTVSKWLNNPFSLQQMSASAKSTGRPNAAAEIVCDIGGIAHKWMDVNDAHSAFVNMHRTAKCNAGKLLITASCE